MKSSSRKKPLCNVGDRILAPNNKWGTVTSIASKGLYPYTITWDNGHSENYSAANFEKYQYQVCPPDPASEDIEEEDLAQLDLDFSKQWKAGDRDECVDTMLRVIRTQLGDGVIGSDLEELDTISLIKAWYPDLTFEQAEEIKLEIYATLPKSKPLFAVLESSEEVDLDFSREQEWKVGDRATDSILGEVEILASNGGMVKVRTDCGCDPWLSLEGTKALQPCSDNLTSAQESELASHSQDCSSEDLPLLAYASEMNTAETFSSSGIQRLTSTQTLEHSSGFTVKEKSGKKERSISSQPRRPASRSQFKVTDGEPMTQETASQQLSVQSQNLNPNSSASKTLEDSSVALTDQDLESDTSQKFSPSFPSAGMMRNGKWLAADTLGRPSVESDYCWLASPGAMSTSGNGRPPGTDRLTDDLQSKKLISSTEVAAPEFLEKSFSIPIAWTSPSELRAATELLAAEEKRLVTVSIHESPPSHSDESCISTVSLKTEEELMPVDDSAVGKHFWCDRLTVVVTVLTIHNWRETPRSPKIIKGARCKPWWNKDQWGNDFPNAMVLALSELVEIEEFSCPYVVKCGLHDLEKKSLEKSETHASKQIGSLYKDTEWRTNKTGEKIQYPRVDGERDPANDDHWYWYISYVVRDGNHKKGSRKSGGWKDTTAYIPRKNLSLCRELMRAEFPIELTVEVCQVKWLWTQRRGNYLIGESKPEACPRLVIVDFQSRELFISGLEWGESTPAKRHAKQRLIGEAIANGKSLAHIKEVVAS